MSLADCIVYFIVAVLIAVIFVKLSFDATVLGVILVFFMQKAGFIKYVPNPKGESDVVST